MPVNIPTLTAEHMLPVSGVTLGIAEAGIKKPGRKDVHHRRTALHASLARVAAGRGDDAGARAHLERARRAPDRAEPAAVALLALATAEVLPADDANHRVLLASARTRILRTAARREDARAYCAGVRLHRHLLELTGGVPTDLPGAP